MDLCLTDDPAAETECNADSKKNKLSKSSAGPLQVNKITQEIIPVGGDTISLVLNIEADVSLSDNQQLMPIEDITETSCLYINDDLTIKINADVILKGTRVNGIYDSDPEKNKNAIKFDSISFDNVLNKNLKVMDSTAFTLSKENNLPIIVFNMNKKGNLFKIISGEKIGSIVK